MPNICEYTLRVRGKGKDVKKFLEYLEASYSYTSFGKKNHLEKELKKPIIESRDLTGEKIETDHHIGFRTFDCDFDRKSLFLASDEEPISVEVSGNVAWSLEVCWFDRSAFSYFENMPKTAEKFALTLPSACALLDVSAEVFSAEPGMEFSEHFYISRNGEILNEECCDYAEFCIGDYQSFQDALDDGMPKSITEEMFLKGKKENEDYLTVSDLMDPDTMEWKFTIECDI